jgi:hypothetical protein
MSSQTGGFRALAAQVKRGDAGAVERLRQRLGPEMRYIVSQALRPGAAPTPMTRHIRAQAEQLVPGADRDSLVGSVAQSLCESILDRLGAGLSPRAGETVRA